MLDSVKSTTVQTKPTPSNMLAQDLVLWSLGSENGEMSLHHAIVFVFKQSMAA